MLFTVRLALLFFITALSITPDVSPFSVAFRFRVRS